MKYAYDDQAFEAIQNQYKPKNMIPVGDTLGFLHVPTLDTTADCVKVLQTVIGMGNWKRVFKKKYMDKEYRSFEDKNTNKIVTIYLGEDPDTWKPCAWVLDCDLRQHTSEIDQILAFCHKHYFEMDMGDYYYNPKTKIVFINSSDCGFFWTPDTSNKTLSQQELDDAQKKDLEENYLNYPNRMVNVALPFLNNALIGDEFSPDAFHGYIHIGDAKDINSLGLHWY